MRHWHHDMNAAAIVGLADDLRVGTRPYANQWLRLLITGNLGVPVCTRNTVRNPTYLSEIALIR
jgi:hypothetical protein